MFPCLSVAKKADADLNDQKVLSGTVSSDEMLDSVIPVDISWCADLSFPLIKAQRYITQLKSQINSLEAELEEQRAQKQRALLENEQLRMELEATRRRNAEHESLQSTFIEAESKICN